MRDLATRVMDLQLHWDHRNTPEMKERGEIIRGAIPDWLRAHTVRLKRAMGTTGSDFDVEGRDGTGRKTELPWVRFYSDSHSPHATEGWYCVYLFDAPGDGFYLGLAHGSTRFIDGEFQPRKPAELEGLVSWAEAVLHSELAQIPDLVKKIDLRGTTKLSAAYAQSTVVAVRYAKGKLPSNDEMVRDAERFAALLGKLYEAQDLGLAPEVDPPEVSAAMQAVEVVANPLKRKGGGQGFGLSAVERRVVELHAMGIADAHLKSLGFETRDVSATESYDILATKSGSADVFVEVKGTTSYPGSVVLTAPEVSLNRRQYPNTILIVVHQISLDRVAKKATASGGELLMIQPWKVEDESLTAISFRYNVPSDQQ